MREDVRELLGADGAVACEQQKETETADAPSCRGLRVLVAEDVLVNQKLVGALLQILGCESDFAVTGQEAVEKAAEGHYDIVLMDVMMPIMDGLLATEMIRSSGNHTLPIIALTASVAQCDHDKCLAAGLNDFLPKPIDPQHLKEILIKWGAAARNPASVVEDED